VSPRDVEGTEARPGREVVPTTTYFLVFAALMVLLVLTAAADKLDLGPWGTVVSLGIAFAKAGLIAAFFMHLRGAPTLVKAVAGTGAVWLAIAMGLSMTDQLTRGWRDPRPSATDLDWIPQADDRFERGPDVRPPRESVDL
jgi:cytochrome c oxidase subunit 4